MITVKDIQKDPKISSLINAANKMLEAVGYTEHGPRHVGFVSVTAEQILRQLGFPERECELAAIAGWVHDVGNAVNRHDHGPNGAILLFPLLREIGMDIEDVMIIITAVSAALVIADKSDAHRTRVRRTPYNPDDIHDRVNYAISANAVEVDAQQRTIRFSIEMDDTSSVMDFMAIYLTRMQMCEEAAHFLGCRFELVVNGVHINRQGAPR